MLEATARILTSQGFERLTTNAVAELAGVSVGSVYQYFPGREALVAELRRRHLREVTEALSDAVERAAGLPIEESLRCVVRANVEVHARDPGLHYLLTVRYADIGYEVSDDEPRFAFSGSDSNPIANYLRTAANVPRARALTIASTCVVIIEALTHASLLQGQPRLSNDALVDEIVTAVLGYLDRAVD